MEKKTHLCSTCVNWLELQKDLATCDFDHFVDVPLDKAELFIPELFDCVDYEKIKF